MKLARGRVICLQSPQSTGDFRLTHSSTIANFGLVPGNAQCLLISIVRRFHMPCSRHLVHVSSCQIPFRNDEMPVVLVAGYPPITGSSALA